VRVFPAAFVLRIEARERLRLLTKWKYIVSITIALTTMCEIGALYVSPIREAVWQIFGAAVPAIPTLAPSRSAMLLATECALASSVGRIVRTRQC